MRKLIRIIYGLRIYYNFNIWHVCYSCMLIHSSNYSIKYYIRVNRFNIYLFIYFPLPPFIYIIDTDRTRFLPRLYFPSSKVRTCRTKANLVNSHWKSFVTIFNDYIRREIFHTAIFHTSRFSRSSRNAIPRGKPDSFRGKSWGSDGTKLRPCSNSKILKKSCATYCEIIFKGQFESGQGRFELFTNTLINVSKRFNKTILFERRLEEGRGVDKFWFRLVSCFLAWLNCWKGMR